MRITQTRMVFPNGTGEVSLHKRWDDFVDKKIFFPVLSLFQVVTFRVNESTLKNHTSMLVCKEEEAKINHKLQNDPCAGNGNRNGTCYTCERHITPIISKVLTHFTFSAEECESRCKYLFQLNLYILRWMHTSLKFQYSVIDNITMLLFFFSWQTVRHLCCRVWGVLHM